MNSTKIKTRALTGLALLAFFNGDAEALKRKPTSLADQVCRQRAIVIGKIVEVKPDYFTVLNATSKPAYTDFFTIARIEVKEMLHGSWSAAPDGHHWLNFYTHSVNSPYEFGDKHYVPKTGDEGIWLVLPNVINGYQSSGNDSGPLLVAKKNEIKGYSKACKPTPSPSVCLSHCN
jgi:hypothetical protein